MSDVVELLVVKPVSRDADVVLAAALEVIAREGYRVVDTDPEAREVRFTRPDDTAPRTYLLSVDQGTYLSAVGVRLDPASAVASADGTPREARRTARRLVRQVRAAAGRAEPSPREQASRQGEGAAPSKRFLADLTGGRVWLAFLVLTGAYLVPLALVWALGRADDAALLGDAAWVYQPVALALGVGLVVALTIRFGGWFQAVSFGEEYVLSFRPGAGFALGWWRFVVQVGALVLVALLGADVGSAARERRMTSPETEAIAAYADRAPILDGWELRTSRTSQSEYVGRPNATRSLSFLVPAELDTDALRDWLAGPEWAEGVDGREPIGALRDIECYDSTPRCEAEVTPPDGEPVERTVVASLSEVAVDAEGDGTTVPGGLLRLEIEYRRAER